MSAKTPETNTIRISYRGTTFEIDYFHRRGNQETILFVHGLGGAKENYWEASKSDALADHTLIAFDNPGTGGSSYYDDLLLDINDLTAITSLFIDQLDIANFILCGTSMGGLTTLLYLKGNGRNNVKGYINIEGNLMPEDCMFSSKVVTYEFETFAREISNSNHFVFYDNPKELYDVIGHFINNISQSK